jgi:hypothetical protein
MVEKMTEEEIAEVVAGILAGTHQLRGGLRDATWTIALHARQITQQSWPQDADGNVHPKEKPMSTAEVADTLRAHGRRVVRRVEHGS